MTGKTRILVVEHETPLGMRMAFLLTSAGCEVQAAHTGQRRNGVGAGVSV